jgi:alpha-tubulin suppressor-like RCC1 family protein
MSRVETTTNFRDSNGVDLGKKLVTKDYLLSVYPSIAQELGKTPELWTWGHGIAGKLGNGATTGNISTPITTFAGGTNWKQVSSGNAHTSAIKTDGTLWTWGYSRFGRLGQNSSANTIVPTPITTFSGGANWSQVSNHNSHTAAIKTDGTLWVWGVGGTSGQLGNAVISDRLTPVTTFAGGTNWRQVSAGGQHTAAIKTDGTLWTWGSGSNGRLGNGATTGNISTPITTFAGGTNWKQVSAAGNIAAIKTDGTLWTWGLGTFGVLGNGAITGNISTPITTFAGGTNWKQVIATSDHTAAIKTDGTLWTWGRGSTGQLGNNQVIDVSTPITTFAGGTNWKQVSCGLSIVVAIKTDGTLWTWGSGSNGRLGNGVTTGDISTPVTTFAGGANWKQVSCGFSHTAAIQSTDFI